MTWLKLSDDFGDTSADLSDSAFRTHVEGLLWAMRRETGGALTARDLRRFAESDGWEQAVDELVKRGFWEVFDNGYLIRHHMQHQVEPDVLDARRQSDAERQRRKRSKAAGLPDTRVSRRDSDRDSRRDEEGGVTRDTGLVGTGLDRTGTTRLEEKTPEDDTTPWGWPAEDDPAPRPSCSSCGKDPGGFALIAGRCRKCRFG